VCTPLERVTGAVDQQPRASGWWLNEADGPVYFGQRTIPPHPDFARALNGANSLATPGLFNLNTFNRGRFGGRIFYVIRQKTIAQRFAVRFIITYADVAERAGVSVTSVSHVNNQTRGQQDLRNVLAAMNELGYSPMTWLAVCAAKKPTPLA
jgi:hypothetical protein